MVLEGKTIFHKLWYFVTTYILTLKRFDLFLQGTLLIVILLETNVYLLLDRDANEGYLPKLVGEWVRLGAAGIEVVLGAAVAWFGKDRRQLALSGWLAATSVSGLLVFAFPFAVSNPPNVELCGGTEISLYNETPAYDSNITGRTAFLVITMLLCALSKVSIWAHGITYLDDHDPQNGAYFYGILISIRLSLGLSGFNWLRPSSTREDWWEAHLCLCMLTFMFSVLFTLFPRRMKSCVQEEEFGVDTGFCASLSRIVRNKVLIVQTLGFSFLSAAVFCYVLYDRAYVSARFHIETIRQDPRSSRTLSDIFRSLVIIFFVMIFRVRFSARRSDGVKTNTASRVGGVTAIFVAIFFTVMASISCDTGSIVGATGDVFEQPICSQQCGCNSERYGFSPVCAVDIDATFFSPCNAGCAEAEDLNGILLLQNCTCSTETLRAVRGACSLLSCRTAFGAYQVIYTVMLAVSGASFMMFGMAILRAVRPADKAIAVGTTYAVVALLAFVLGNLLYMAISYLTCVYPNEGACLLHHPSLWSASATSALLALLAAITSIIASKIPGPPKERSTEF
ncbi:unnamed protein product [Arctia plantaginis]|uniref:Kazal-like domain-containing protein n=1 Tax=Arctia plantaginis TaxID=874455 RepID=A0A8S0ZK53_ARCPL|nr:unnamed protein product [Arctia plantaginis]